MNLNPYQAPEASKNTRRANRRARPYLMLNGIFALVVVAMILMPFLLPVIHITNVSTSSNGDPITSQTTLTSITWSWLAIAMIPIVAAVANGVLYLARTIHLDRQKPV